MKATWAAAWLVCLAGFVCPTFAQTHTYSVYIDLDNNPSTGCTITTPAGSVSGIETILSADVSVDPATVTGQQMTRCNAGVLDAPSAVSGTYPYPVGFDQGVDGFDVIELGAPLAQFGATAGQINWRLSFGSEGALLGGADLTDTVLAPGVGLESVNPKFIPAASLFALALLALALAIGTVWMARRRPHLFSILLVTSMLGLSGLAWAAAYLLDGNIGDWSGAPLVTDPQGDATADEAPIDIRQAFAGKDSGKLFFRIDVQETRLSVLVPPLLDTQFSIPENSPNGTVLGPVRTSSTGLASILTLTPTSQTPGIAFSVDPLNTNLSVSDTALLDFETHAQFQLGFSVTLTGLPSYTLPLTVLVDIQDVNEAPALAAQSFSVQEHAANGSHVGTVVASDGDAGANGTLTYSITGGSGQTVFAINPGSGAISVADAAALDVSASPFDLIVSVSDGGTPPLATTATMTLSVIDVNDAPSFTPGGNVTVNEDSGAYSAAWASAVSDGDDGSQTLSFDITANDNPALFATAPALAVSGSTGQLSFTPAADASGVANLTVVLRDNGGTANGGIDASAPTNLQITVTAINDAPSFTPGGNVTVNEDSGAYSAAWASAVSDGDDGSQALSFDITANDNPALFATAPALAVSGSTGQLSFTPAADASGVANLTVVLRDNGGTANGGVDASAAQSFSISVVAINDAPVISLPAALGTNEDNAVAFSGANAISVADVDIGAGTLDLALDVLQGALSATASGTATVTGSGGGSMQISGPLGDVNATLASLIYSPNTNYNGSDTLTVSGSDNGNTGAGGAQSGSGTTTITINAINDAPVNTVPTAAQQVIAGMLTFSAANGNALSVSDADADPGNVQMTLAVSNGTLTLSAAIPPALTLIGNGTDQITLTGPQALINAALDGLTYATSSTGTDSLTVSSDDLGNSGAGGALTDVDTVSILIDQAPSVTASTPQNGDTLANNAALSITFSEAVDVAANAVTLTCGGANLITGGSGGSGGSNVTTLSPTYAAPLPSGACVLTVLAANVTDVDSIDPPDAMTADYVVNFSVDAAPQVSSVLPSNGATDVAVNSTITVTFSESVDIASAGAFSLECPGGSPIGFTVTSPATLPGSATSFTLTPSAALPAGTSCTFTVIAAAVDDTDSVDPPSALAANFTSTFSTDSPPTVTSVMPANGAVTSAVPTLTVNFSEAVNLDAGVFSLDCTGAIATTSSPALPASGVTSISFTPDVALPAGAACTASVLASAVHDADSNDPPDTMATNYSWNFAVDAAPSVSSIVPANGASHVNPTSNIVINFSEPVNFDTAANAANTSFALECPGGTPVDFTVATASPAASVTLDPLDNAIAGRTCTLTVRATGISDVDALDPPDQLVADVTASFSFGAIANDDSVNVTPHLSIGTANGAINLTSNDILGAGQITAFGFGSCTGTTPGNQLDAGASNGRLTLGADGSFNYEPPAGVANATRTFCYTVTGGDTANVAFVIQSNELVWFVDAAAAAGGIGTQARPFNALSAAGTAQTANDTIYVASHASPYTAGLTLLNGVRLIGQGATGTLAAHSGVTPVTGSAFPALGGTAPTLTASNATAITLGTNNSLSGFIVGDTGATGGTDIAGTNFGTVTVAEVALNGNGRALNLDTGAMAGTGFTGISVTASGSQGIRLVAVTGTLALGSGAIAGTAADVPAFQITGNLGTLTYSGSISKTTAGRLIDIDGAGSASTMTLSGNLSCTGSCGTGANPAGIRINARNNGTYTFSGSTKTISSSASNPGISLTGNTGATIHFTGGGLNIVTTSGTGFAATGGGTVSVQGTGNTLVSTTGTALNVTNTSIAAAGLSFQSVSANGAGSGIVLNNTGTAAGLTVTGNGNAGSGGTIQNTTSHGILFTNTSAVSLNWMNIQGSGDDGIFGTRVAGLALGNVNVTNNGNSAADDGIYLVNPSGALAFTNVVATGNAHNNLWVYDSDNNGGNTTLTITGGSFSANSAANGNHGALIDFLGNATLGVSTINGTTFQNNKVMGLQVLTGGSAAITDLTINNNTFADTGTGNSQEISMDISKAGTSTLNSKVLNTTTIRGHNSHGMNFFTAAGAGTTGVYNARIAGNVIGDAATAGSGSVIGNCARININGDADAAVLMDGNNARQCPNGRGFEVITRNGTGGLDLTVTNNDVNTNDVSGFPLASIFAQSNDVTIPNTLRADIRGNTVPTGTSFDVIATFIGVVESNTSTCQVVGTGANPTAVLTANNTGSASADAGCSLTPGPITTPP